MSRVLDYYPHLTGRLCINPESESGAHQINNLGSGAELLHAECQSELRDFTSTTANDNEEVELLKLPDGGNDLLAPYDMDIESVCNGPVMTVQHTSFACGGVSLGIRILHTINDAAGFFKFVSDLAEIYRSLSASSGLTVTVDEKVKVELEVPPDTRPYLSDFVSTATADQVARAKQFKPTLYHLDPDPDQGPDQVGAEAQAAEDQSEELSLSLSQSQSLSSTLTSTSNATTSKPAPDFSPTDLETAQPPAPAQTAPNTGRVLRFTPSELIRLKSQATDPDLDITDGWISTFDALTAFLHQRIYAARHRHRHCQIHPHLDPLTHPDLLCPVDIRRHLPDLSPGYTGNAVLTTYASFSPVDLLTGPLHPIARSVHDMTRQTGVTDSGIIRSTIEWMAVHQHQQSSSSFSFRIANGFRYGNASLMLSQWNKIDIYTLATFDRAVRPALVAPPFTPISLLDGLGYYLPTPHQGIEGRDGGIDVYLSLSDDVWAELDVSVS